MSRFARALAGLAVLAVAIVAGIVSFTHIETLALEHGYAARTTRLLPVSVDGLIIAASLALLTGARSQRESQRLARAGLVLGILATLAANVEAGARFGVVGAIINAWPAVAFIVASEILLGMLRGAEGVTSAQENTETVANPVPADVPVDVPERMKVGGPVAVSPSTAPTVPVAVPRTVAASAPRRAPAAKPKAPERIFAAELERGELPSIRAIKSRAKCGTPRATEIRAQLALLAEEAQPAAA